MKFCEWEHKLALGEKNIWHKCQRGGGTYLGHGVSRCPCTVVRFNPVRSRHTRTKMLSNMNSCRSRRSFKASVLRSKPRRLPLCSSRNRLPEEGNVLKKMCWAEYRARKKCMDAGIEPLFISFRLHQKREHGSPCLSFSVRIFILAEIVPTG